MKIYFDGSARPNPGTTACAAVSECGRIRQYALCGYGTNNTAEWKGFLLAIRLGLEYNEPLEIVGDSKLVVEQANGRWRVKDEGMKVLHAEYLKLKSPNIKVNWVRRNVNLAGIYIEELHKNK